MLTDCQHTTSIDIRMLTVSVNTSETMLAKCAALSTLPLKLSRLLGHGTDATHDVLAVSRAVYDDAVLWCVCACVCVGMCVCVCGVPGFCTRLS